MIASAAQDEPLLEDVLVAILASDSTLAAIKPARSLEDDGFLKDRALSLDVQASFTGKEINIVCSYDVTITLLRQIGSETDSAQFSSLWRRVVALLQAPPAGLSIYSQLTHLTFDDLDSGAEPGAQDDEYTRQLTFRAFMAKA